MPLAAVKARVTVAPDPRTHQRRMISALSRLSRSGRDRYRVASSSYRSRGRCHIREVGMDQHVVADARPGDTSAFEALVVDHHHRLFRVASGILRDPQLARMRRSRHSSTSGGTSPASATRPSSRQGPTGCSSGPAMPRSSGGRPGCQTATCRSRPCPWQRMSSEPSCTVISWNVGSASSRWTIAPSSSCITCWPAVRVDSAPAPPRPWRPLPERGHRARAARQTAGGRGRQRLDLARGRRHGSPTGGTTVRPAVRVSTRRHARARPELRRLSRAHRR
jgi:hypothetical protein